MECDMSSKDIVWTTFLCDRNDGISDIQEFEKIFGFG